MVPYCTEGYVPVWYGTALYSTNATVRLGTLHYSTSKSLHFSDFTTLKDTAFTFLNGTVRYGSLRYDKALHNPHLCMYILRNVSGVIQPG